MLAWIGILNSHLFAIFNDYIKISYQALSYYFIREIITYHCYVIVIVLLIV